MKRLPPLATAIAIALAVALAIGLGAGFAARHGGVSAMLSRTHSGGDFVAFYCAGKIATSGADPYRVEPLRACEHALDSLGAAASASDVTPAPLPGYSLALFGLLARLPYSIALGVWYLVLLASLCVAAWTLTRITRLPWYVVLAALAVPFAYVNLRVRAAPAACGRGAVRRRLLRARAPLRACRRRRGLFDGRAAYRAACVRGDVRLLARLPARTRVERRRACGRQPRRLGRARQRRILHSSAAATRAGGGRRIRSAQLHLAAALVRGRRPHRGHRRLGVVLRAVGARHLPRARHRAGICRRLFHRAAAAGCGDARRRVRPQPAVRGGHTCRARACRRAGFGRGVERRRDPRHALARHVA